MSKNFVFQSHNQQKNFYLSDTVEVGQFCKLMKSVFGISENIVALSDINNTIYDISYFCQNLYSVPDRFFIILTDIQNSKRKRTNSRQRSSQLRSSVIRVRNEATASEYSVDAQNSPYYIQDIEQFLRSQSDKYIRFEGQQPPQWTIILMFDTTWQANLYSSQFVEKLSKTFPFIQVFYTIHRENECSDDTILFTLFQNQNLKFELELKLDILSVEELIRQVIVQLQNNEENSRDQYHNRDERPQGQYSDEENYGLNNIPIIVTRGDERQVLHVEPNENFHSSQGKRTQGLMRIKRDIEKVRHNLSDLEYETLLDQLVSQDPTIIAAYQLFQKNQNEEQFLQNLKSVLPNDTIFGTPIYPQEENNLSFNKDLFTFKDKIFQPEKTNTNQDAGPGDIVQYLLRKKKQEFLMDEFGMLRVLQMQDNQELDQIISSILGQDEHTIIQVLKPYLKSTFLKILSEKFSGKQIDLFYKLSNVQMSPIYAAFLNFSNMGGMDEFQSVLMENLLYHEQENNQEYSFPPSPSKDINDIQAETQSIQRYSKLLNQKGNKRKSTFKIRMIGELQLDQESPVNKRKLSDENNQLQLLKEQRFLDRYHARKIRLFNHEHDQLMNNINERKDFLEIDEKQKVLEYYKQGNQRLRDIFERFLQSREITLLKQDLSDLVQLDSSNRFEISSPVNAEKLEPKMLKLKNFRFLINYLYEVDKVFTLPQCKTLNYLYVTEDISVLSAYEVYCENNQVDEFVQTLSLIFKIYFLGNSLNVDLDEIEQWDELIDQQLNILFAFRRFFTIEQRGALEKNSRAGDNTILKQYKEFLRNKNQEGFIDSLRQFADLRAAELKRVEQIIAERRQNRNEQKNENKDLIEKLHPQFMRNKVKHLDMLLEGVEKDSLLLKSAFEVHSFTHDKQDLVENLILVYHYIYKHNVKTMLKSLTIELRLSKGDLTILLKRVDQEDPILKGSFELYYVTRDEPELKDTIQRILKTSNQ